MMSWIFCTEKEYVQTNLILFYEADRDQIQKKKKGPSKLKTAVNIGEIIKDPEEELRKLRIQQKYEEIVGRETFVRSTFWTKICKVLLTNITERIHEYH